jgi:hypothetical protein
LDQNHGYIGISTPNSDPLISDFTKEEIYAVVDDIHRLGKKISGMHMMSGGIIYRHGSDSIEHGLYNQIPAARDG